MDPAISHKPPAALANLPLRHHGHDERNLAEFPLVLLTKRPPKGMHTVEYQDYDHHPKTGAPVLRKVTITASGKYLLPTSGDEEVLMALIYLTLAEKGKTGFDDPTVRFSRRHLLQILGWPDTGSYYNRLKQAMRRWKTVNIVYENWWDSAAEEFNPELAFSLIDNYKFVDGRRCSQSQLDLELDDATTQKSLCFVKWNEAIFASFKSESLKTLDLDMFFRLPTAAAKRAYRYLNFRLPATGQKEFDLNAFACQHVGFSPNYKPSRLRSEVQEAIVEPLERNDFIEPLPPKSRFHKRNGRDCITFTRKPVASLPPEPAEPETNFVLEMPSPLLREFTRRGLSGKLAAQFVASYPADYLGQKLEFFDFASTVDPIKRPGGWLRRAVEEDWQAPPDFVPRQERERQAEAKLQQQQAADAARRREREEADDDREFRQRVDDHLKELTNGEIADLERNALAAASPETQANYASPIMAKFRQSLMATMIREYLRPILATVTPIR